MAKKDITNVHMSSEHIKTVHQQKKYFRCKLCDKSFKHKISLNNHIKNVHDKAMIYTTYVCKLCQLKIHMSKEHRKPHKCELCEKSFTSKSALQTHKNSA